MTSFPWAFSTSLQKSACDFSEIGLRTHARAHAHHGSHRHCVHMHFRVTLPVSNEPQCLWSAAVRTAALWKPSGLIPLWFDLKLFGSARFGSARPRMWLFCSVGGEWMEATPSRTHFSPFPRTYLILQKHADAMEAGQWTAGKVMIHLYGVGFKLTQLFFIGECSTGKYVWFLTAHDLLQQQQHLFYYVCCHLTVSQVFITSELLFWMFSVKTCREKELGLLISNAEPP